MAVGDVGGLAIGRDRDLYGGVSDLDWLAGGVRCGVDGGDGVGATVGDVGDLAVRRDDDVGGQRTYVDRCSHSAGGSLYRNNGAKQMATLELRVGDVDGLAAGRNSHGLSVAADID